MGSLGKNPIWLDRERADQATQGVDAGEVTYDPEVGIYRYQGKPFTGIAKRRYADGRLRSLVHFAKGVAHGVSVAWYPSGQIELYNEMALDVCHGLHVAWDEDGTKRVEDRYQKGRLAR
jgi:antitoxin component YwqK of YwqJK toxin-antitoxin module